jgi:hypothetical protein
MMKAAEQGAVRWIVVDQLDRFGTRDAHQLVYYLYRLRECGCKLYDGTDREWTAEDVATIITAVVEGEKSKGEQTSKSHRVLGGKVEKARAGEWQGGPVRLGFDVACYSRATGAELWRVIFDGFRKRLKLYPDGRAERFDGKNNFPKFQEETEVLRVALSRDKAKIDAAVSVFERYASESISFTALARYLNDLGFRNSYGGMFLGCHVGAMLEDPIYLGYYSYNKVHLGKFNRYKGGQPVPEFNYDQRFSKNDKADWVHSYRLFDALVSQPTWDAVQRKLDARSTRTRSPRSPAIYLAGLVYCGNCGGRMVAGPVRKTTKFPRKDGHTGDRYEYFCGTYFAAVRGVHRDENGRPIPRTECKCLRNGVFQDTLEEYVKHYLEETGTRLELLTGPPDQAAPTGRLARQAASAWDEYLEGIERLEGYLKEHHTEEYAAILEEYARAAADGAAGQDAGAPGAGPSLADRLSARGRAAHEQAKHKPVSPGGFVRECLACYRAHFDPAVLAGIIEQLEAEHTALMRKWADLPTPRAKEKARERFAALEARIEELRRQQEDAAVVVEHQFQQIRDLQQAVAEAKRAMKRVAGERALRQRAEALRAVIQRIECTFTSTGLKGGGWGKKNARLVKVAVYPVGGDSVEFSAGSKGTLMYSSAHSRMKRTRVGRMR